MKKYLSLITFLCLTPCAMSADVLGDQLLVGDEAPTMEQVKPMLSGSYELDQLAGVAFLMNMAGTEEAFPLLGAALKKSKLLQLTEVAALIGTSTRRTEHVAALLSNSATRSLGAASLASLAIVEYVQAEKEKRVGPAPLKNLAEDDRVILGGPKSRAKAQEAAQFSKQIGDLLREKDESLVEYGLIAAAYTADKAHAETISDLRVRSGGIAGLKLLYAARTDQPFDVKLIESAFKNTNRGEPHERESGYMARCQICVPSECSAAEAVGLMGEKGSSFINKLHDTLLFAKDIRSQVAAAIALGKVRSNDSVVALLKAMEKCEWPVLVHVLEALGRIPSAQSVEPLIKRYAKERGRFRLDCLYAINSIAGERLVYTTSDELNAWWAQAKSNYQPDRNRTDEFRSKHRILDMGVKPLSGFYGARIYSNRLVFAVDSSGSMKGEKIDSLRSEIKLALEPLENIGHAMANVVDFGAKVEVYYPDDLTSDIKGIIRYVTEEMDLSPGTRSMDAIIGAIKLNGVDSIYFLSDGSPVNSIRKYWSDIRRYVNFMNRYRPVAVFCIPYKASVIGYKGMGQLSWEHDGICERIE